MSLCPKTKKYLDDNNISISKQTETNLSSHPPEIQQKAVVNPAVHNIIQGVLHSIMSNLGSVKTVSQKKTPEETTNSTSEHESSKEDEEDCLDGPINIFDHCVDDY